MSLSGTKMRERMASLDTLRAMGALMILIYHTTLAFANVSPPNENAKLFVILQYFYLGVQLFFLLSAFSLSYSYFNRLNDHKDIKKFIIRRFLRIAPLFYIMILVWRIYFYYNSTSLLYIPASFEDYLFNFTFLFNLIPEMNMSLVIAGWSIGNLFLFYFIFPILISTVRRIRYAIVLVVGLLFLSSAYYYYISGFGLPIFYPERAMITQLPFFFMGILCFLLIKRIFDKEALLKKRLIKIAGLGLIIFGILLACMLMWQFGLYSLLAQIPYVNAKYYAWGLAFSCLTIGLLLYPSKIFVNRVTKFLGVRSYSIYLIHPVVAAIFFDSGIYNTIYYGLYGESGYIALLVCILLTFCVVMILSSISYWLIEKPIIEQGSTARLEWLKSKIIRKNS